MPKKLTLQEVKRRVKEKGFIFLDKEYNGNRNKYSFKCLKHNKIHKATYKQIESGSGLKCCGYINRIRASQYTLKEVKKISLEKGFEFIDNLYNGCRCKHRFKCLKHNEIHTTRFDSIVGGRGLRCCLVSNNRKNSKRLALEQRLSLEEVKERSLEKGFIFLDNKYFNSSYKHRFKCIIDGKINYSTFNSINSGQGLICCKIRKSKVRIGVLSSNWNPKLTDEDRANNKHSGSKVRKWSNEVKKRDNYKCQICGDKEKLHAFQEGESYPIKIRLMMQYDSKDDGVMDCMDF